MDMGMGQELDGSEWAYLNGMGMSMSYRMGPRE